MFTCRDGKADVLSSQAMKCYRKKVKKLLKVSLNIKKCTNVSGRALHQCKNPIVASWHTPYEETNGESALACNVRARETQL